MPGLNASLLIPLSVAPLDEAVDLFIDEQHTRTIPLSEYPIEDGSVIASHAAVQPDTITLRGAVGNLGQGGITRAPKAWDLILEVTAARVPVQVVTRLREYPQMIITEATSTAGSGGAVASRGYGMDFTLQLRELVTPGVGQGGIIPRAGSPTAARADSVARGRVSPGPAVPAPDRLAA